MKRIIALFSFFLFSTLSALASHMVGGTLTHECVGNNQYVFRLSLIRDCAGASFLSSYTLNGPLSVPVTRTQQKTISRGCVSTPANCATTGPGRTFELNVYESAPVTINLTPPAAGLVFSYSTCCYPGTAVNLQANSAIYVSTTIYPSNSGCASSGQYHDTYVQSLYPGQNRLKVGLAAAQAGDSLYHRLSAPMASASAFANFRSGYSATYPLPSDSVSSANGPNSMNGHSGVLFYDLQMPPQSGLYFIGVVTETWRNGQLVAKSQRVIPVNSFSYSQLSNNVKPQDTLITTGSVAVQKISSRYYQAVVYPGDTLAFTLGATDSDTNTGGIAQQIEFIGSGMSLDSSFKGIANNFSEMASFSPASGQSGFSAAASNAVNFHWAIANEHRGGKQMSYFFNMEYYDDWCPINAVSQNTLEVVVKPVAGIAADTLWVCEGDSVALVGNTKSGSYSWSPAAGLSDATLAKPMASPSSSGYYYLSDPINPQAADSVYVMVEERDTFALSYNGSQLQLIDSVFGANLRWYYNGVSFSHPTHSLIPFAAGDYFAYTQTANCRYYSDTVTVPGPVYSTTGPGRTGQLAPEPKALPENYSFTFELNAGVKSAELLSLFLPGLEDRTGKMGSDNLRAVLYDAQGTEIWREDTSVSGFSGGVFNVIAGISLQGQQSYTLAIAGDSGFVMPYYQNVTLPYSTGIGGMTVTAINAGTVATMPSGQTDRMLAVVLNLDNVVSAAELNSLPALSVYPNPASGAVTIAGLQEEGSLRLFDIQGRLLAEKQLKPGLNRFEPNGITPGVYTLKIRVGSKFSSYRLIFK